MSLQACLARLGVVLVAVAVGVLGFSASAFAASKTLTPAQAAPPDPNTIGATTLSNIELNGRPGTVITVRPGEEMTMSADWSDSNTGCPGCSDYTAVGFAEQSQAGCIEEEGRDGIAGAGTVDLGPAPETPGTYDVVAHFEEVFNCGEFWSASDSDLYPVVAEVEVVQQVCTGIQGYGRVGSLANEGAIVENALSTSKGAKELFQAGIQKAGPGQLRLTALRGSYCRAINDGREFAGYGPATLKGVRGYYAAFSFAVQGSRITFSLEVRRGKELVYDASGPMLKGTVERLTPGNGTDSECSAPVTPCSANAQSTDGTAALSVRTTGPSSGTENILITFGPPPLGCTTPHTGDVATFEVTNAGPGEKTLDFESLGAAADAAQAAHPIEGEGGFGYVCYESPTPFTTASGAPAKKGPNGFYGQLPFCEETIPCVASSYFERAGFFGSGGEGLEDVYFTEIIAPQSDPRLSH